MNGEYNGWGKLTYANGDFYEGQWTDSQRNGIGMTHETDRQASLWRLGKRVGKETLETF